MPSHERINAKLDHALACLRAEGLLAYPTEAVYALGCDPFSEEAVNKLLTIKQRPMGRGLILIASAWEQVKHLTDIREVPMLSEILDTWPGPITWTFPASARVPKWIRGQHNSVAIRITAHPLAHALCAQYEGPIVSTSANKTGDPPACNLHVLHEYFTEGVDYILCGELGGHAHVSEIWDAVNRTMIRGALL